MEFAGTEGRFLKEYFFRGKEIKFRNILKTEDNLYCLTFRSNNRQACRVDENIRLMVFFVRYQLFLYQVIYRWT